MGPDCGSVSTASFSPVSPFLRFVVTQPSRIKSVRRVSRWSLPRVRRYGLLYLQSVEYDHCRLHCYCFWTVKPDNLTHSVSQTLGPFILLSVIKLIYISTEQTSVVFSRTQSTLVEVLLGVWRALSHCLSQHWLIVIGTYFDEILSGIQKVYSKKCIWNSCHFFSILHV